MKRPLRTTLRATGLALVAAVGLGTAALVGVAFAKTFTLKEAKNAKVINANTGANRTESIVTNARGFAVYTLSGDSKSTPKCLSKNCRMIWPPLTVSSKTKPTKGPGVTGKLTVWHHNGFFQVVLGGHPLYLFSFDKIANDATGEAIHSFGGTWHVVKADPPSSSSGTSTSTMTTTTTTTTGTTPPTCTLYC